MLLFITIGEVTGIIGAAIAVFTAVGIPVYRTIQNQRGKRLKEKETVETLPETLNAISSNIQAIKDTQTELKEEIKETKSVVKDVEVTNLRYMINDTFFGYDKLSQVPDEVLENAAQCCDIYIEKGYNHKTAARCATIYEEINRRAREKNRR